VLATHIETAYNDEQTAASETDFVDKCTKGTKSIPPSFIVQTFSSINSLF